MLVCIWNKEIGTEWLVGNLFSAWIKISINHPVILMLSLSLCISDIKLQIKGRKSLSLDDTWLLPLLGLREGRWHALAGCWGSHWLHMSCILRNQGTFIPKQSSALEFNGLPSPTAFNFHYMFYHCHTPASSVCQGRGGRRMRLGVYANIPIRNIIWNNLHHK